MSGIPSLGAVVPDRGESTFLVEEISLSVWLIAGSSFPVAGVSVAFPVKVKVALASDA